MRRYSYETVTDLPPEQLFRAFTDVQSWPQWDDGIEAIILKGPANEGAEFALVPRGLGKSYAPVQVRGGPVAIVGPGRDAPARYSGEDWCTNGSGTNSVNPPVRSWISRSTFR